jgi:MoxR-like ATPase
MVRLSIGYPDRDSQVAILKQRRGISDMDQVQAMMNRDDVKEIQDYLYSIHMTDDILYYISELCEETRKNHMVELGVSPRGVRALSQLARARAMLKERDYVVPEDVQNIFLDVCAHRLTMKPQAKISGVSAESVLRDILRTVKAPSLDRR